jgi:ABC-2 type transport system ATP-binding protein
MSNRPETAVEINDIHKEFILPQHKNSSFKQTVVNIVKQDNKVTQKVLDGVSFNINKGDFFGIVGRNGSGKSTLLKLIAGVYTPNAGEVKLHGGLTPFIELGVGFNPELSGRDNVFLNGALLGYDRKQMAGMYDEIVEFAELGPFMDQKLKNYSSGMQVRLAFSIAIKAKNEILIFDEVLAVGDEAFQRKCLDVFEAYKAEGQTVILVTHDMATVRRFCNKAALIHQGKLVMAGDAHQIADKYTMLNVESIASDIAKTEEDSSAPINISYAGQ